MVWTNRLLWLIYLALLGVLLPHTAWAFGMFEPDGWQGLGWIAALAFEGAIAAFTWRLKQAIEDTKRVKGWRRFRLCYLNVYSAGLLAAVGISSAANWAHAVQFGVPFKVFTEYQVPPNLYAIGFGAILPFCSLLFARILADAPVTEEELNPELEQAKADNRQLKLKLRETEERAALAEARFQAMGDLAIILTAEDKRRRIVAAHKRWPQLTASSLAIVADASPAYVSAVTKKPSTDLIEEVPHGNDDISGN